MHWPSELTTARGGNLFSLPCSRYISFALADSGFTRGVVCLVSYSVPEALIELPEVLYTLALWYRDKAECTAALR